MTWAAAELGLGRRERPERRVGERDRGEVVRVARVGEEDGVAALREDETELDERRLRAGDDRDLARGVELDAVHVAVARGDRLLQLRHAAELGVAVRALVRGRALRRLDHVRGRADFGFPRPKLTSGSPSFAASAATRASSAVKYCCGSRSIRFGRFGFATGGVILVERRDRRGDELGQQAKPARATSAGRALAATPRRFSFTELAHGVRRPSASMTSWTLPPGSGNGGRRSVRCTPWPRRSASDWGRSSRPRARPRRS